MRLSVGSVVELPVWSRKASRLSSWRRETTFRKELISQQDLSIVHELVNPTKSVYRSGTTKLCLEDIFKIRGS